MSENKVQIVVEVDAATGQATIRQLGEEMDTAGRKGASGFDQASAGVDRVRQAISKANPPSQQLGVEMDTAGKKGARGFGEASTGADRLRQSMAPAIGLAQQLGLAFGAYEMVQGGKWALQTADSMLALDNRMLLSARNTADYVAAQETVVGVAKQTHQELGAVGQFYTRLAIATKDLNVSQQDLADVTRGVNIAVALSGSASQEATAGVQQFSQAMSLGRLQGDEFRSMMENIPMVAMAVIDGLGLSVAEFRNQSEQGLITTERMIEAVKKKLPELEAQAEAMPMMVGMAMNDLRTSASLYVEEVNQAIGVSASMAQSIGWLGENLDTVAKGGTMAMVGALAVLTGRGISAVVAAMPRMIALVREYAVVTETATRASGSLAIVTETTSRVSMGAAATRLMTMPNIIGAVTTALTLGATAWAIWGGKGEDATERIEQRLQEAERYNKQMKEMSDPGLRQDEIIKDMDAVAAEIDRFETRKARAIARNKKAGYDMLPVPSESGIAEARKNMASLLRDYEVTSDNIAMASKARAVTEVTAEMSIAAFEKKMAGERALASATGLQKDLLDIEKRKDEAIAAARTRFKDTTEFARAEAAINSRYAGEEAKAREAAGKKTRDEGERTRKEYVKTRAEYEKKTDLAGLEGIHKELKEIGQEAAGLAAKYGSQDWIDTWQAEAEQAAIAKDRLKEQKEELAALGKVRDAYHQAMIASLPEEEQAVARVTDEYRKQQLAVLDALNAGEISADEAWARSEALSQRETEATRKALDTLRSKNDEMIKIWDRGFENMQDITGDWLEKLDISWDSAATLFRKMVAQMVNTWLWAQASMAWTGGPAGAANVAGAAGGAASAASAAGTGFSLASAGSVLSNFASTAFSWDVIGHAGAFAVNHGLETLGTAAMDTANWLNDLPIVGDLGLAGVFSAISAFKAFSTGNEIGGLAHTAATIAAVSGFPVVAAAIEAVNFLGELSGLWGKDKENTFTLGELVQPGVVTDTSFNRSTGFDDPGWQHPAGGNEWYHSIADAYADTVAAAQKVFDEQVFALVSQLPEEMKNQILGQLEATDYQKMLLEASGGRWGVSGAKDALQGVAKNIVTGLTTTLSTAYATSLSDYITSQGAAGLVGDSAVWAVLSDRARDTINDLFTSAAATIKGGDVDGGIAEINKVTQTISQIAQALAPIQEAVDIADLTDYQKSLRSLNQQYAQYRSTLEAAGIDLERLTILTTAYNRSLLDLATENVGAAAAAYMAGLETEQDRLQDNVDTTRDRYLTLLTREHDALDDLTGTLGNSINSIRRARKNLYDEGGSLLTGQQQRAGIDAEINRIMAIALGSDPKAAAAALAQIEDLSGEYVSVSKSLQTDWRDYARDLAKIQTLLDVTETQAVTLKSDAQLQIDRLDLLKGAVDGATETALTLDEARRQYEQAVYELEASGIQGQLEVMTSLYGTAQSIEQLLAAYLAATLDLGKAQSTAGRTGEWVQTGGWQTWTSTGGAVGQAPKGATSLSQVEIVGVNGQQLNAQAAVDEVNRLLASANGDPAALRAVGTQIYNASRELGVSAADLDLLMGWAPNTSNNAVESWGLERFETGGSFVASGPAGVDNLTLPGLRVSPGEMVHVSRPDTMAELRGEIRALRLEVEKLRVENNQGHRATNIHTEKTASVMKRSEEEGFKVWGDAPLQVEVVTA